MSCKHGNWAPCDECDEEDARWERAYASGAADKEKLWLLLRECDAALGMLSSMPPVLALRAKIAATVGAPHCMCDACKSGVIHKSDCALHNEPALPKGPCDCGMTPNG